MVTSGWISICKFDKVTFVLVWVSSFSDLTMIDVSCWAYAKAALVLVSLQRYLVTSEPVGLI